MTTPQIKLVDATTGEEVIRDMNAAELKQLAEDVKNREAIEAKEAKAATDKAALLTRLGITADEAKLLLS